MTKRHHVLRGHSTTLSDEPLVSRIDKAFSQFAERTAATDTGEAQCVTYDQVRARVSQLSQRLGHITSTRVGLALEPSIDLLVASIAVIRRGLTYVAIDPSLPLERLKYIIRNSNVDTILHAGALLHQDQIDIELIDLRDDGTRGARLTSELPSTVGDRPICIFYTSGSAGRPKAVPITWTMLRNRLEWQWRNFAFDQYDVICAKTKIGFLDSLCETWAPFLIGTPIVYVKPEIMIEIPRFLTILDKFKVTRMTLVPSMLRALLVSLKSSNIKLDALRYLISSGEALEYDLCISFFEILPHVCLLNFYGSTEVMADILSASFTSMEDVRIRSNGRRVAIGSPIDNTSVVLHDIDEHGIGELVIAGPNVFRGYLFSDVCKEAGVFAAEQLGLGHVLDVNQPVFKTGDRCQLLGNEFVFLGRADRQVKIAGNRFDLSEVDTALADSATFVTPPVVVSTDEKVFAAYLQQETLDTCLDLAQLRSRLPQFALPKFIAVAEYPLFPTSGKIDRQRLVEMCVNSSASSYSSLDLDEHDNVLEGLTVTERAVVEVMTLIGIRAPAGNVLMRQNFFEAGGSSLNAIQAIAMLKERKLHITMKDFLSSPTISHLAQRGTIMETGADSFRTALPNDWSLRALEEARWEDAAQLVARGFADCCLPNCSEDVDSDACTCRFDEILDMARAVQPYCLRQGKQISFGLFNQEDDLLGVFMNYADDFQPVRGESSFDTYLEQTLSFVDSMERPTLAKLRAEGYKHILHSFLIAIDRARLKNPEDAVQSILAMEFHLLDVARTAGFEVILAINTHPATQQAAEFVLGYKIDRVVGGPRNGPDECRRCFDACDCNHSVVQVCYKDLKEP